MALCLPAVLITAPCGHTVRGRGGIWGRVCLGSLVLCSWRPRDFLQTEVPAAVTDMENSTQTVTQARSLYLGYLFSPYAH